MPRRPARPVSWVYSPGVRNSWCSPVNFDQLLDHHRPGRHVDAERQRLGGEHHLHQALDEARLDRLLERRHHARRGGRRCRPRARPGTGRSRARRGRRRSSAAERGVDDLADARRARSPVGEPQPGVEALLGRLVARVAAEDEVDRRQHPLARRAARRPRPAAACTAGAGRAAPRVALPRRRAAAASASSRGSPSGFGRPSTNVGSRCRRSWVRSPTRYRFSSSTGRRSSMIAVGRPAHRRDPVGQLLGVRHRGRQAHQPHVGGQVDDHLLPHRAAVGVLEVVHLVEHDERRPSSAGDAGVDHVAQHLGGHHHDRRVAVDRVVAGEQADAVGAVARGRGRGTSGSTAP